MNDELGAMNAITRSLETQLEKVPAGPGRQRVLSYLMSWIGSQFDAADAEAEQGKQGLAAVKSS